MLRIVFFFYISGLRENQKLCRLEVKTLWHYICWFCIEKETGNTWSVFSTVTRTACEIDENCSQRINLFKKLMFPWEKRNLNIAGRICIIKSFVISQFVYAMLALVITDHLISEINRIFHILMAKTRLLWKRFWES